MPYGRKPARAGCPARRRTFGFQAGAAMRKDLAAGAANPEHARYRAAADVGVEHPDARATLKRRELINGTACVLPCPPSPQVQKSAATSALPGVPRAAIWIAIVERLNSTRRTNP